MKNVKNVLQAVLSLAQNQKNVLLAMDMEK
jgi:hypothetical protein